MIFHTFLQKKEPGNLLFLPRATFTATVLNFCVRDGNRCVHRAIVTRLFFIQMISEN